MKDRKDQARLLLRNYRLARVSAERKAAAAERKLLSLLHRSATKKRPA